MDDVTWSILALLLTGAGGAATWWAFTRRGPVAGTAALGWTLLVPAAWLTGVLQLLSRVSSAVGRWATHLAFDLTFWLGIALGSLGALLVFSSRVVRARGTEQLPPTGGSTARPEVTGRSKSRRTPKGDGGKAPAGDDDFADIESLLRKRGIE